MKNKIKAIQGIYPITVFDAVKKGDGTNKTLSDVINELSSNTSSNNVKLYTPDITVVANKKLELYYKNMIEAPTPENFLIMCTCVNDSTSAKVGTNSIDKFYYDSLAAGNYTCTVDVFDKFGIKVGTSSFKINCIEPSNTQSTKTVLFVGDSTGNDIFSGLQTLVRGLGYSDLVLHNESGSGRSILSYNGKFGTNVSPFVASPGYGDYNSVPTFDFTGYCNTHSLNSIDVCVIALGWNHNKQYFKNGSTNNVYRKWYKEFIEGLRKEYPDCKIILLGEHVVPYGYLYEQTTILNFTHDKMLIEITTEYENIVFSNVTMFFDCEYGCSYQNIAANQFTSETQRVLKDVVHPTATGSNQYAIAVLGNVINGI